MTVPSLLISKRLISALSPPLIIAEIGINHGGSLETAKNMVYAAYKAGCECIKHQTHFVDDEMTDEAKKIFPPHDSRSIWDIMHECSLSPEEELQLKNYSESLGLIYLSTPFSRSAADFLDDIGVPAFKIGSGECDNLLLIEHIASKGKPIIMSTGMQSIESIYNSVQVIRASGVPYALLECTNLYPSPPECVSLSGITQLREAFDDAVIGFSDHSIGPHIALASVALGASIIERHFTDSRYRSGPDISCSMDPTELSFLISRSIEVHTCLHNKKQRSSSEDSIYKFARGTLVADRDLPKGHVLTKSDIWGRRPGNGEIPAYDFKEVIGKELLVNVRRNTQLSYSHFK